MHATHPVSTDAPSDPHAFNVTAVCKAAGDPLRASILKVLARDSFGVLELCELFDMAQPAMSQPMRRLAKSASGKPGR